MHVAIGYYSAPVVAGYHLEQAFRALGHRVTYVGLPTAARAGFDSAVSIAEVIAGLPEPVDLYLWIDPAARYFPRGIEQVPVPTACYLIDVHLGAWRRHAARFFDAVFLAQKDYVPEFRGAVGHDQVFWLPLAAAPYVHHKHDLPLLYDVGFVGNVAVAHRKTTRARRLRLIADQFRTNDFYRPYSPQEVGRVYSQSRIVFNTSIAGDVTMRVFEGTACGALLLTDSVANGLGELFAVGKEIVTFADDPDLLAKISYFLDHEAERAQVADAGHRRTIAEHSYLHRAQSVIADVTAPSFRLAGPMRTALPAARMAERRAVYTHLQMTDSILDEARAAGYGPPRRGWAVGPCLARRILR